MSEAKNIVCIGTNHKRAPIDLREYLFIAPDQVEENLGRLKQDYGFNEIMLLSTCNRLEIIGVLPEAISDDQRLASVFLKLQELCGHKNVASFSDPNSFLYIYKGEDACLHVSRVAASLDSLVVGETQITGQFKEAVNTSRELGLLGSYLDRLSQDALKTAKKVRNQTEIGKKSVSIASAAVDLISAVFTQIDRHSVLVIGAGEMARVVSKHILKFSPRTITIANRSESRAIELIQELGRGEFLALESLADELERFDIVVTATAASQYLLKKEDFLRHMSGGKTKLCVDISLPRNIDPATSDIDELFAFDIDDLKQIVDTNTEARTQAADQAEIIVKESTQRFLAWVNSQALTPYLKSNHDFFAELIESEFRRSKIDLDGQSEDLTKLKQSLIKTLASTINQNLQNYDQCQNHPLDYEMIAKIFRKRTKKE